MKVGILGGTNLGKTLGKKFLEAGLDVVFGVRSDFNTELPEWKILNKFYNRLCPYESAIIQADFVLICCEDQYLPAICESLQGVDLDDKIIIDCTNKLESLNLSSSNTLKIQNAVPNAVLFKAFNNLGLDYPEEDVLGFVKETYFCGNSINHKKQVKRLIELIGYKAIYAGMLENAILLEAFYHLSQEIRRNRENNDHYHFKLIAV